MKKWDRFYDLVLPDLPGMPPAPLVDAKLREAAITLCSKGRVHRNALDLIDIRADVADYDLETDDPRNLEVAEVREVWCDGRRLEARSAGQLAERYGDDWRTRRGAVLFYLCHEPQVLTLVGIPDADVAAGLRVEVAFCPTLESAGVADWVFDQYALDLATGAKALLMAMPKKPWSDLKTASIAAAAFQGTIDEAAFQAGRNFTRARRNTRARFM